MGKQRIQAAALAAVAGLGLLAASPAEASLFTFTVTEQGGTVYVAGFGSINLTGLSFIQTIPTVSGMLPSVGSLTIGGRSDVYGGLSGPEGFGSGGYNGTGASTGDPVYLYGFFGDLAVPQGYVSGHTLSDSLTFDNKTFATLGLTPGIYTYTWGNVDIHNKLIVEIATPNGVPEPSTWAMLALGFIGLAALGARRGPARAIA
jgi:PEP-CTERM motif